jgi:uncharacterized DUF497 family protein
MKFSWDEFKRQKTIRERDLDFEDARLFFGGRPILTVPTPRDGEERWKITARIEANLYTLVWMWRGDTVRIVSMRRAHGDEERAYRDFHR